MNLAPLNDNAAFAGLDAEWEQRLIEKLLKQFSELLGEKFSKETLFSSEFHMLFVIFCSSVLLSLVIILKIIFVGDI